MSVEKLEYPKVKDLMTKDPVTVTPEVTIRKVMELMNALSVRHVPVLDQNRGLLGVISDRDLSFLHQMPGVLEKSRAELEKALDAPIGVALKSRFLVSQDVVTLAKEDSLQESIDYFVATGEGALAVVDEDEQLVGILSVIDVLRWVGDQTKSEDVKSS